MTEWNYFGGVPPELYGRTSRRGQLTLLGQARLSVADAARQFGVSTSRFV